jgi:hypothetical protein
MREEEKHKIMNVNIFRPQKGQAGCDVQRFFNLQVQWRAVLGFSSNPPS